MNPDRPSATWHSTCVGCGHPFTQWEWNWRHDINDDDARTHRIEAGEYHDTCCPIPTCTATTNQDVAS